MISRFFIDPPAPKPGAATGPRSLAPGDLAELSPDDSHHARSALRLRPGDLVELVAARSRAVAVGRVERVDGVVAVRVEDVGETQPVPRVEILLVQGLPQPKKVDEIVEKGTEVGVDAFLVVSAAASPDVPLDRLLARIPRWAGLAREAAKQSRQLAVPTVDALSDLYAARASTSEAGWCSVVLDPAGGAHLRDVLTAIEECEVASAAGSVSGLETPPLRIALWVGPESGWSQSEVECLVDGGARTAHLGRRILRTETAGPVAASLVRGFLSDW